MAFHTGKYDVYVVLGDPDVPPIWKWKVWKRFLPSIDPLIQAARGKPAVRSTQYVPNTKGVVKFGRLGWNEPDHQKWTHGSPSNKQASKAWSFLDVEVWAPAWTLCERENVAPDVFFSFAHQTQYLSFNPVIVFAIVSALAQQQPSAVASVVSALRELTSAKLVGHKRRPWGMSAAVGYTNAIQDLAINGLFKPGPRHKGEVGFHLFAGKWEPIPTEATHRPYKMLAPTEVA